MYQKILEHKETKGHCFMCRRPFLLVDGKVRRGGFTGMES